MGCCFASLRFRAEQPSPLSSVSNTPSKSRARCRKEIALRDRFVSREQLASVFAPEGNAAGSRPPRFVQLCVQSYQSGPTILVPCSVTNISVWSKEKRSPCEGDAVQGSVGKELKCEAKFLKYCGALLATPAEFTKASQKKTILHNNQDDAPNNCHFNLRVSSCNKLQWNEQAEEASCSPSSRPNGCLADSMYCEVDLTSPKKQQIVRTYSNILHSSPPVSLRLAAEIRTRSVRFEAPQDACGVETDPDDASEAGPQNGSHIHSPLSKYSPYPTPLKLTDEMETPRTLYPAKVEKYRFATDISIRSQYIYPVFNPMLSPSPKKSTGEVSQHLGQSGELPEQQVQDANSAVGRLKLQRSVVSADSALPWSDSSVTPKGNHAHGQPASLDNLRSNVGHKSAMGYSDRQSSDQEQAEVSCGSLALEVPSFSPLPEPTDQHDGRMNCKAASRRRSPVSSSPERNRPNIGTVSAHWNSETSIRVSPKMWNGNGIPNSTNKYKEDQRVSWHATPFEERLEKALSDEKLNPHRLVISFGRKILCTFKNAQSAIYLEY
ncbi:hypothetical protein Taro_043087 [Colocasia esculenta]|uniref:Uncharacterized protein n=1 Tax=Colocasia esculenta TaxID=4460 RepID=A0A843WQH9_COLES|nr:hypothetical protein [Colocasia esculenta]